MSKVLVRSKGIGFLGVLAIVFIVLKLTGHITWSWFWVLTPLWAPASIGLGFLAMFVLVVLLSELSSYVTKPKRRR